ncbi:hypothetical protein JGU66_34865 [Myxococcaceae bacterium JPH2]|nr:hypothetical protein [Myxococcaceae bacterium JPH2]
MKKHGMKLFAAAVVLLGAASWAGEHNNMTVSVDLVGRIAAGDLGTARNTTNTKEFIGCTIQSSLTVTSVQCRAGDATGTQGYCNTTNPAMVETARAINGDDRLAFLWDANNNCTLISLEKFSAYPPKNHDLSKAAP